jgi:hypothetical protein
MQMINNAKKMKKSTFAILAAPSAMPPKPNTAAMIAITKKTILQRNIVNGLNEGRKAILLQQPLRME